MRYITNKVSLKKSFNPSDRLKINKLKNVNRSKILQ